MQKPFLCLFLVCIILLVSRATVPIGVPARRQNQAKPGGGHVFPYLRWLCDAAIETILGRRRGGNHQTTRPTGPTQNWYQNNVVLRFNVTNSEEEGALAEAAQRLFLDVWAFTPDYVDIRIRKENVRSLLNFLPTQLQLRHAVVNPDVEATVWRTYPSPKKGAAYPGIRQDDKIDFAMQKAIESVDDMFFRHYQPLSDITSWLRLLRDMFPSNVEMLSIGTSYEGRDILTVRVGDRSKHDTEGGPRKTILVTGGVHGREWISVSTVNYLLWSFVTAYGKDRTITQLIQHFDIVFIPVLNPDGYQYTWDTDRLWRKSRQQTEQPFCRGLDINHAFGHAWDPEKHADNPCSDGYGGDVPLQAVEASALASWAQNQTVHSVKFVGFIDLHSYAQQILFPYSYSCDIDPPNRENLEELAAGLAKSIRLSSGEFYSIVPACQNAGFSHLNASSSLTRGETGGGSLIDWFYHEMRAHYSYQIKLRDTGGYGFLLPSENIVPTGTEIFSALKYLGDFLLGKYGIKEGFEGPDVEDDRSQEL